MGLQDTKNNFLHSARMLPTIEINGKLTNRYEDYTIDMLADKYGEAKDNNDSRSRDIYLSAIFMKLWFMVDRIYQKVKTAGVDREDIVDRMYTCIDNACTDRAWQKNSSLNAQQVIMQVFATRVQAAIMYESNLNKNTKMYTILDQEVDDENATTVGDLVADPKGQEEIDDIFTRGVIQELIGKNKIVEAIIADNIAFKDVFKHEKTTISKEDENGEVSKQVEHTSEFWPFKLVKELNELDDKYLKYFATNYRIKDEVLKTAVDMIVKVPNNKLYNYIRKSIPVIAQCLR